MGFWDSLLWLAKDLEGRLRGDDLPPESELRQDMLRNRAVTVAAPRPSGARSLESRERIRSEIHMVAPRFAKHEGVNFDEASCDWLEIPKYPLPEKWRARWCKLLVIFPALYPVVPPIGFYLNRQFKLVGGDRDGHLTGTAHHGAPDLTRHGWHWYCVQIDGSSLGGWRPSADFEEPDNLFTYLTMVREVLTND